MITDYEQRDSSATVPDSTTITVYTRDDCHLCEDAIARIRRVANSISTDVTVELVDVDDDATLRQEYGNRVPYVLIDDRPMFKYRVDADALRDRLRE